MTFSLGRDIRQYARSWMIFFFMVCIALICLPLLPATIATHWNGAWQTDGWGTKWTLLEIPLADAMVLLALKWIFTGISGKYEVGSRIAADPNGFLHRCWLTVSLFLCVLEMLMLTQGFHAVAGGPRFLLPALSGAVFLLLAAWTGKKSGALWTIEGAGLLLMVLSVLEG